MNLSRNIILHQKVKYENIIWYLKLFLFLIFFMYHFIAHVQYFYLPSDLTVLFIVNVQHHDDEHGSHKNQINKHLHPMH